jgi:hypothetical protein
MAGFGACTFSGQVSPFPAHFSGTEGIMQLGTAVVPVARSAAPSSLTNGSFTEVSSRWGFARKSWVLPQLRGY